MARKPRTCLDIQDVRLMRALFAERERLKRELAQLSDGKIAEKFGVSESTVGNISTGKTWGNER